MVSVVTNVLWYANVYSAHQGLYTVCFQRERAGGGGKFDIAKTMSFGVQTQEVVQSEFFLGAFQSSVKWCASAVADALQSHFVTSTRSTRNSTRIRSPLGVSAKVSHGVGAHQNQNSGGDANGAHSDVVTDTESINMATAAIVPRLAKVSDELLSGKSEVAATVCQLPAVRALLDAAFACGPFLDMQD
jgi:hypothetical protein